MGLVVLLALALPVEQGLGQTKAKALGAAFDERVQPRVREAQRRLESQLRARLDRRRLQRPNGFVYAIDLAQLLAYAALQEDRELYERLRAQAEPTLVERGVQGGRRHTFVAWRYRPGDGPEDLEASGTTEALELARALWLGAQAFDRPGDRALALRIVEGYARHQSRSSDFWYVRNYYDLTGDAFADNSYLVDYDPDFVGLVARAANRPSLCEVAPVAERSAGANEAEARRVLEFARARGPLLRLYYDAASGQPRREPYAGLATYATLVRLAVKLDEPEALAMFFEPFEARLPASNEEGAAQLYELGQGLLALGFLLRASQGEPLPEAFAAAPLRCEKPNPAGNGRRAPPKPATQTLCRR